MMAGTCIGFDEALACFQSVRGQVFSGKVGALDKMLSGIASVLHDELACFEIGNHLALDCKVGVSFLVMTHIVALALQVLAGKVRNLGRVLFGNVRAPCQVLAYRVTFQHCVLASMLKYTCLTMTSILNIPCLIMASILKYHCLTLASMLNFIVRHWQAC